MHIENMQDGEFLKATDTLFLREDFKHTFAVHDGKSAQKEFHKKKQTLTNKQAVMERLQAALQAKMGRKSFARNKDDDDNSRSNSDNSVNITF